MSNVRKLVFFLQKWVQIFFFIQFITFCHFSFLTGKGRLSIKGNKSKTEESRTFFCRQSIQLWSHQISKWLKKNIGGGSSSKIASQSSVKIPATKHKYMMRLNYSGCALCNILILLHLFHVLYLLWVICKL